ncbi:MAG: BatE protein [Fibrobacter sp.]|jgi:tetratricopeptide (TPR) repeat protein|nr:BatE protein [Fibrobacter sp.]
MTFILRKLICILSFLAVSGFAESDCSADWQSGIQAYQEGRFDQAILSFSACADAGIQSADLYYNLANAYFREGQLGYAILYDEAALRLAPADKDIQYNLKYARERIRDKTVEEEEENPILNALFQIHHALSLSQELWLLVALVWLLFFLVLLRVWVKQPRLKNLCIGLSLVLLLPAVLTVASAAYKTFISATEKRAVILLTEADVMSGPGDSYQTLNTLSEGTVVEVTGEQPGFFEIRLGEKVKGFIKSTELGLIP